MFGQYQDYRVVRSADGYDQVKNENRYIVPFPEINSNFYGEPSSLELGSYNGLDYHSLWQDDFLGPVNIQDR